LGGFTQFWRAVGIYVMEDSCLSTWNNLPPTGLASHCLSVAQKYSVLHEDRQVPKFSQLCVDLMINSSFNFLIQSKWNLWVPNNITVKDQGFNLTFLLKKALTGESLESR
jgi:hypothetical protein